MHSFIKLWLVFFLTTFIGLGGFCQNTKEDVLDIQKIEVDGDFLRNNVNCAFQDSRGFMWFGTEHGLGRYDGHSILEFNVNNSELDFNTIYSIFEDEDGYLWVMNFIGRYSKLWVRDINFININTFEVLSIEERFPENFPGNSSDYITIKENLSGEILFIDSVFTPVRKFEDGQFKKIEKDNRPKPFTYMKDQFIYSKGTEEEVYQVLQENEKFDINYVFWLHGVHLGYHSIGKNSKKELIVAKFEFGKNKTNPFQVIRSNGEVVPYYPNWSPGKSIFQGRPFEILIKLNPKTSDIWVFGSSNSLILNPKTKLDYDLKKNHPTFFSENILDVYFNDDINWICSDNGVFKIEVKSKKFKHYLRNSVKNEELYSCRTIFPINEKDLIVSSINRSVLLRNEKVVREFPLGSKNFFDQRGDTLLYWHHGSLVKQIGNEKIRFTATKSNNLWDVFLEKKSGKAWFGFNQGLGYWQEGMDSVRHYDQFNRFDELATSSVFHITKLKNNNFLLGTSTGVYELSETNGIINRFSKKDKPPYFLPQTSIYYSYEDKDGIIWLGTNGGGLIKWDKSNGEYQQYTTDVGLSSNLICAIFEDDFNNLWMSSYDGLMRFDKETKSVRNYYKEDGLTHNEFNRGSYYQAPDGEIHFGGMDGVNSFYPKELIEADKHEDAPLELTKIYHFDVRKDSLIDKTEVFKTEGEITLRPREGFLNIEFALLDFNKKEKLNYFYQIEGRGKKWHSTKENKLILSGLPYGHQQVRIKGLMSNGKFSKHELVIPIQVIRPFYLNWFYILLFLCLVGICFTAYLRRKNRLLQDQQKTLQRMVDQQTKQLQNDKDLIEIQAKELMELDQAKSRFFANISHELRTPITLIQGPIQSIIRSKELSPRYQSLLQKAEKNTTVLLNLVKEILDLTGSKEVQMEWVESPTHFYTFLKKIVENFQPAAETKGLRFQFEYHPPIELEIKLDKEKFTKIVHNLLSNAFKFTDKGGLVRITVEDLGKKMLLQVKDNGMGIPKKDIEQIFDRFFQSNTNKKADAGMGIGLALSMEYVNLMKGKMWAVSYTEGSNKGSSFFVEFPKKELAQPIVALQEKNRITEQQLINPLPAKIPNQTGPAKLLVVEDNEDLREYLFELLSPTYNVALAENGQKAIDQLNNGELPALIISDIMMPVMDGFELLENLKNDSIWCQLPIIMLTARVDKKDKLNALRTGVDDYITKPFLEEELLIRINYLLGNYANRMAAIQEYSIPQESKEESNLPSEEVQQNNEWLDKLEQTILDNLQDLTYKVPNLAHDMFLSERQLYRMVKQLVGLTPNQYIKSLRLAKAREFLEEKKYNSAKKVASAVGYKDAAYFSKLYLKEYGRLPADFFED